MIKYVYTQKLGWGSVGELRRGFAMHCYVRATRHDYVGLGLTKLMYPHILAYAKDMGFSYVCHETTNVVTQHICRKYGKAKEVVRLNYEERFGKHRFGSDACLMFQVCEL